MPPTRASLPHLCSAAALGLFWVGLLLPSPASAHLGHLILRAERYLKVGAVAEAGEPGRLRVVVSLSLGAGEGGRILAAADADSDGEVSAAERDRYLASWAEGLREELPVAIEGEEVALRWGEGYLEPIGPVRPVALSVEMVGLAPLPGGRASVSMRDGMRAEVFDRTDVAFEAQGEATLIASALDEPPTERRRHLWYAPREEPASLRAIFESPEAPTPIWLWGLAAVAALLLSALGWRAALSRGSDRGEAQNR